MNRITLWMALTVFTWSCRDQTGPIRAFSSETPSIQELISQGFERKIIDVIYFHKQFGDTSIAFQFEDPEAKPVAKLVSIRFDNSSTPQIKSIITDSLNFDLLKYPPLPCSEGFEVASPAGIAYLCYCDTTGGSLVISFNDQSDVFVNWQEYQ